MIMQSDWKDSVIIATRFFGREKIEIHFISIIDTKAIPKTSEIS